ncbi:MAG: hypothetical protein LH468_02765 [Nocardioides sp.]|nr:hypothetical protein [Nocardioides sp.]
MAHTHAAAWGPGSGRWGHWAPQILIVAIGMTIVLGVAPMPPGNVLTPLSPVLLLAVVIATWVQMRRHDRSLCEYCVAAMPLNPSASAQRYARRLALVHQGSNRGAVAAYLAVLLAANLALAVAPAALVRPALCLWVLAQSSLVYLVLSHVTHRRLQPWCARCGGGGEGRDDIDSPGPLPVDSLTG